MNKTEWDKFAEDIKEIRVLQARVDVLREQWEKAMAERPADSAPADIYVGTLERLLQRSYDVMYSALPSKLVPSELLEDIRDALSDDAPAVRASTGPKGERRMYRDNRLIDPADAAIADRPMADKIDPPDDGKAADAHMPGVNPVWCGRTFPHPAHITVPGSAWCAGEPTAAHHESTPSRSSLKREAVQRGEPMPSFDDAGADTFHTPDTFYDVLEQLMRDAMQDYGANATQMVAAIRPRIVQELKAVFQSAIDSPAASARPGALTQPELATIESVLGRVLTHFEGFRGSKDWGVDNDAAFAAGRKLWDEVHNAVAHGTGAGA